MKLLPNSIVDAAPRPVWRCQRLWFAVPIVALVLASPVIPVSRVERRIDTVTGSMAYETVLFYFFSLGTTKEVSPLEHWLVSSDTAWRPNWIFLSETDRNIYGVGIIYGCGETPPIYTFRPWLRRFVTISTDEEIMEFLDVMQTGSNREQENALQIAFGKSLAAP